MLNRGMHCIKLLLTTQGSDVVLHELFHSRETILRVCQRMHAGA